MRQILVIFLCSCCANIFAQNIAINTDGSAAETGVMLDVKGTNAKASGVFQNIFQIGSFNTSASQLKMRMGLQANAAVGSRYATLEVADLASPTVYRPLVFQANGGFLGIGTTSPSTYLQINTTSTNTANTTGFLSGIHHNINPAVTMGNWRGIYIAAPTGTGTITSKYALVTEATAGFVGIGTITPGAQLEVNGQVKITGGTPASGDVLMSDATGLASWTAYAGHDPWSDGGTYLYPTGGASRNVSIGSTSAPTSKLFVYSGSAYSGSGTTALFLTENHVSTMSAFLLDLDFVSASAATANDKFIRFMKNGSEVGSVNSQVVYSAFTGGHIGQAKDEGAEWVPGMIVCISEESLFPAAGNSAWFLSLSSVRNDKSAIGVYAGREKEHHHSGVDSARYSYSYNALGDGLILVTDQGGNVNIGDYITTSDLPGYGMKQNDDIVHNYTVAKATDSVNWNDVAVDPVLGFKWKLVACTYHSG